MVPRQRKPTRPRPVVCMRPTHNAPPRLPIPPQAVVPSPTLPLCPVFARPCPAAPSCASPPSHTRDRPHAEEPPMPRSQPVSLPQSQRKAPSRPSPDLQADQMARYLEVRRQREDRLTHQPTTVRAVRASAAARLSCALQAAASQPHDGAPQSTAPSACRSAHGRRLCKTAPSA